MKNTLKRFQEERDQRYLTMENTIKKEKTNYMELATRFDVLQERFKQDHAEFSTLRKIT